jgi:hypothetical protein
VDSGCSLFQFTATLSVLLLDCGSDVSVSRLPSDREERIHNHTMAKSISICNNAKPLFDLQNSWSRS